MNWPQAWAFLVVFSGCDLASGYWLLKTNPELLAERMKSPLRNNQRPRDRAVTAVLYVALCVWLVLMALDARRFGWSSIPTWVEPIGAVLVVSAFYGWSRVLRENSFAVTSVRLQPERGQSVISTGPYAIVRHPMYAVSIAVFVGIPLMLGSFWGHLGLLGVHALACAPRSRRRDPTGEWPTGVLPVCLEGAVPPSARHLVTGLPGCSRKKGNGAS
jgi:protein-S-isoprenylcysteine O-methyltransferase Ste14